MKPWLSGGLRVFSKTLQVQTRTYGKDFHAWEAYSQTGTEEERFQKHETSYAVVGLASYPFGSFGLCYFGGIGFIGSKVALWLFCNLYARLLSVSWGSFSSSTNLTIGPGVLLRIAQDTEDQLISFSLYLLSLLSHFVFQVVFLLPFEGSSHP